MVPHASSSRRAERSYRPASERGTPPNDPERMTDEAERLVMAIFGLNGHDYPKRRGYWSPSSVSLKRLAGKIRQRLARRP